MNKNDKFVKDRRFWEDLIKKICHLTFCVGCCAQVSSICDTVKFMHRFFVSAEVVLHVLSLRFEECSVF